MIERRASSLSRFHQGLIFLTTALLWVSGSLWMYWRSSLQGQGLDGGGHAGQVMLLRIHGAAAMAFLIVFGTLAQIHIRAGWRQRRNRLSGGFLVGTCLVLILTGWGLYYIGYEPLRQMGSFIHSYLGLLLPLVIYLHVLFSKRYLKPH